MRVKILLTFLALFHVNNLLAKELIIRYRDNDLDIVFTKDSIEANGYQFKMSMKALECNKSMYQSIERELDGMNERVDSKIFQSNTSIDNILVSTDKTKKEKISIKSPLGSKILSLRSYLAKMQFLASEVCKKS